MGCTSSKNADQPPPPYRPLGLQRSQPLADYKEATYTIEQQMGALPGWMDERPASVAQHTMEQQMGALPGWMDEKPASVARVVKPVVPMLGEAPKSAEQVRRWRAMKSGRVHELDVVP